MLAYLELDLQHTLDSTTFISDKEYYETLGKLSSSYRPDDCLLEDFHAEHKIDFRDLDYGAMHSFVFDKHQYFYFVCMRKVGWQGDVDVDSQCYVKVPYKTIEEIKEEFSFLFDKGSPQHEDIF